MSFERPVSDKIAVATGCEFADKTFYLSVKSVNGAGGISNMESGVAKISHKRISKSARRIWPFTGR
jgi:hypothetical protein